MCIYGYVPTAALLCISPNFGPPEGGPILFLLSPEVSRTSRTMSRYIYIYIYVNNMADAKSVRNLSAIFR